MSSTRLPPWLRTALLTASACAHVRSQTYHKNLATVCREARCPNQGECGSAGVATFLLLGDLCTRNCGFCAVKHGLPRQVDPDEPFLVADAVKSLGLKHAVVTSVTRDDLADGGAWLFAETVRAVHRECPEVGVEVLIPDFQGSDTALAAVIDSRPEVIGHNVETVPRLYSVRQGASYARSIGIVERVAETSPGVVTKSGIMVGMGESRPEILAVMRDLASAGCMVMTIGQYLRPTSGHHPVERFVHPEEFRELEALGLDCGIRRVVAGPLVRSSYKAAEVFAELSHAAGSRTCSSLP
jgi:lipoyl synthase